MRAQRQALLRDDTQPERRPPFDVGGLLAQLFPPAPEPEAPPTPQGDGWLTSAAGDIPVPGYDPPINPNPEPHPIGQLLDMLQPGSLLGAAGSRVRAMQEVEERPELAGQEVPGALEDMLALVMATGPGSMGPKAAKGAKAPQPAAQAAEVKPETFGSFAARAGLSEQQIKKAYFDTTNPVYAEWKRQQSSLAAPPVKPPVEPPTAVGQPEPFQPPMFEDLLKRINEAKGKAARQEMLREPAAVEPGSPPVAPQPAAGGVPPIEPPAPPTGGMAAEAQSNILGLRPIVPGQESAVEGMLNSVRRMFKGKGDIVPTHPAAEAALTERKRIAPIIDSMATDFAEDTRLAASTFDRDKKGLIPSLAGLDPEIPSAPTIQHVAARFPLYEGRLNPDQLAAMQRLRETSTGYERMLRELEVEFGKRPDIIEGGFYLPRGNALKEGAEESVKVYAGRGGKGKGGYRKASEFVTQPEGVAAGYEYTDVVDAVQGTAQKMGRDALDAHVAKYFKNLRDESGALMGETPADRIVPALREKVEGLREKIAGRMQTLRNQTVRGKAQVAETGRREVDMERQAVQGEAAVGRWSPEKEAHLATGAFSADTEASLKTTRTVLDTLVKEENYAWSQLTQAQKRSSGTLAKREATMDAIQGFRDELDSLRSEWEAAKTKSRNTPRTQNVIGLPGLEQWTFPDELANAMNSVIKHERIGEGSLATQSINFVNNSYRQLRATLDNSAQGIQSLLAWGSNPQAAAAASKVNLKAWWVGGDKVLAKWLRDFDVRMATEDMPKIQDWLRAGSQLGGLGSEWTSSVWQKVPVVKQANRSFAAMGDSLRGEWNYNLLKEEMKRSGLGWRELQAQGKLDEIAAITNKMTGWTRKSGNALIQELGELALFAPKFFKARIETVVNGVAGLRPGATMQQRIARQSLLKTIGLATILTTAINYARGKETEYSPIKNGQWNPNFMRIRDVGGRDIALLGTYDSLARAMVLTVQGKPHEALRGLSSGLLSMAWDLISNEDFTGQRTRSDPATFAAWLSKEMVPFSWQEVPEHLGKVGQGVATSKPELAAAGAGAIGGEFLGIKSAALSKTDQLDTEAKKSYGKDWGELTAQQQYDLRKKNPQIAKIELEARSKRPLPDTPGFQAMATVQDRLPEKVKTELKHRGASIGSINRTISWGPKGKMVDYVLKDDEYKLYQELMAKQLMTKLAGVTDKTSDAILKKRIGDAREMALRQLRARLKGGKASTAAAPRSSISSDILSTFSNYSGKQQMSDILSAFLNR